MIFWGNSELVLNIVCMTKYMLAMNTRITKFKSQTGKEHKVWMKLFASKNNVLISTPNNKREKGIKLYYHIYGPNLFNMDAISQLEKQHTEFVQFNLGY